MQDNWPVHFHADLVGQLQKQKWPWPFHVPPHWPEVPSEPQVEEPLPIQLLCLPTYASWLNPIEKLWRYLKQEVLHLHRLVEEFEKLKGRVASFLDRFGEGSEKLLRFSKTIDPAQKLHGLLNERTGGAGLSGAFACRVDLRTKSDQQVPPLLLDTLGDVRDGGKALDAFVRETVQMREAQADHKPPHLYDRRMTAAADYEKIADQLLSL